MRMDFTDLLAAFSCDCGRVHSSEVKRIVMESGALIRLPEVIAEMGSFSRIGMICDENTYEVAGKRVEDMIAPAQTVILDSTHLHANERAVAEVQKRLASGLDLLVAVGSGTIHDITRYVAYHAGLSFISVPTAASVDGYVSNVAAMTWNGAKKTMTACAPLAMVADIEIIAAAPMRLTASGVGDMLGKYTALLDWKIGKIFRDEYYCDHIVGLVEKALINVKNSVEKLQDRDEDAVALLMYGLVLSGVAMQHTGISRPASGSEHHISHFIEMTVSPEVCDALHGEKVGVGLMLVSRLYHALDAFSDGEIAERLSDYALATDGYLSEKFGPLSDEIRKENAKDCAEGITREEILSHLADIRREIAGLPTEEELAPIFDACGACKTLSDIGLSEEKMLPELYAIAPLVRNRLTLMRLLRTFAF